MEAIEGAVEEMGILDDGSVVAFGFAGTSFWILNGRGRSQVVPLLNPNSGGGGGLSALVDGFQYFRRFQRLVKLALLLKSHSIFTESGVSRMRESGDFVLEFQRKRRFHRLVKTSFLVKMRLAGLHGSR